MESQIPDKLYFKIGEVAELTGIKPHVLRYWESEFSPFRPTKSRNQQRLYRHKDIALVFHLKDLLYNQGFTIAGAKKKLGEKNPEPEVNFQHGDFPERQILSEIRRDLLRLRQFLDSGC